MQKSLLIVLTLLISSLLHAQSGLDSLWNIWNDETQADTIRLEAIYTIAWDGYLFSQPDSAYYYGQVQHDFAELHGRWKYMASALSMQGLSLNVSGKPAEAIIHLRKAFAIAEEHDDLRVMAAISGNMGNTFSDQGKHSAAIDQFTTCLEMADKAGDQQTVAGAMINISNIYQSISDLSKAIDYLEDALLIFNKLGHKRGKASTLMSLAMVNKDQGNLRDGLIQLDEASELVREIDNDHLRSQLFYTYGVIFLKKQEYSKALEYLKSCVEISEKNHYQRFLVAALLGMSKTYEALGNYNEAIHWSQRAIDEAHPLGALGEQSNAYEILYNAYKGQGKGELALSSHEKMLELRDSLNQEETSKKLQNMEFAKQLFADSLMIEKERLRVDLMHKEEVQEKNKNRNIALGIGAIFLILAIAFFGRWRYVKRSNIIIAKEKDKSENLLLNILPNEIAKELKETGEAKSRKFDDVSILFTDFKGFTKASELMSATDLVSEINTCFKAFDEIVGRFGVEKIKTIGDAYMAAGGLPLSSEDSVRNTVLAALEMQTFIIQRKAELEALNLPAFEMRVGIHTGPVVAGIVGVKKFQYDIWGDTVNTASRMESSSEVGKVNISQTTFRKLENDDDFTFESRGKIEAKGKGEIEMYFVARK